MNFKQTLTAAEVDIYGISDFKPELKELNEGDGYEILDVRVAVEWSVGFETREWGIKDVCISIDRLGGEFTIEKYDEKGDATSSETIEIDFTSFEIDHSKMAFSDYRTLSINEIEIDYSTKTVEVR